jgi:hypothetical protein
VGSGHWHRRGEEILKLRAESARLQSAIDLLASRGARADLKSCGVGNTRLCVRVEAPPPATLRPAAIHRLPLPLFPRSAAALDTVVRLGVPSE